MYLYRHFPSARMQWLLRSAQAPSMDITGSYQSYLNIFSHDFIFANFVLHECNFEAAEVSINLISY